MTVTGRSPDTRTDEPGRDADVATAHARAAQNPVRDGPIVVAMHGDESSHSILALARRLALRLDLSIQVVSVVEYETVHVGALSASTVSRCCRWMSARMTRRGPVSRLSWTGPAVSTC